MYQYCSLLYSERCREGTKVDTSDRGLTQNALYDKVVFE